MSDGVSDSDVTYRRLLALKEEEKTDARVAGRVLKLFGLVADKGTLLSSVYHPFSGRSIRRWKEDTAVKEDGVVSSIESRGETSLVTPSFPSGRVTYPLPQFEFLLDEGKFDVLDDLL